MRGIIWDGKELRLADGLEVREPEAGEVRVRIVNSGVCHSDVSVMNGTIPYETPVILGHEGAGIVERVGPGVKNLKEGDPVVLSTLGNCGHCAHCDVGRPTMCRSTFGERPTPFSLDGEAHYAFANISSFAEHTVVKANQAVAIPKEIPLSSACLIGCGVLTGAGAVLNRARVRSGEKAVVIGVGGIGLNAIQALALAGAHPIVAVDANAAKRDLAIEFGATHFVDPTSCDAKEAVLDLTSGGADWVFECVGIKTVIEDALDYLDWAGSLVILGVTPFGTAVEFLPEKLFLDKTIMGCRYGSSRPQHDIPRYADLYLAGKFKLDELVTQIYPMESIHQVIEDMEAGRLARGVLEVGPSGG
ncbi:MAG: Zn-dependent alcohol dehydrogenase [bacterium]|nr:Zn-dependent alcohol dehydrogenase [Deltaproteobacteria bacterium]MCP4908125.1 Zn-dependent alcohol dehydrogenase [bacterium]